VSVAPVPPVSMKSVARLATPWEFYWVLEQPAPLAGMAYPRSSPWQTLADSKFSGRPSSRNSTEAPIPMRPRPNSRPSETSSVP
jgi:hypothetical protein